MKSISLKTVSRLLIVDTEKLCVDGASIRESHAVLDKYKAIIQGWIGQGFKPSQIQKKLQTKYPEQSFKRTTVNDYCLRVREELYDTTEQPSQHNSDLDESSKLFPYKSEIEKMLDEKVTILKIFEFIQSKGYVGSYSLLQQYCHPLKPVLCKTKKLTHSVVRRDICTVIWK